MMKWSTISIVLVIMLTSCNNVKSGETSSKEDLTAKEMLQGIWIDDETDMPLMVLAVIRFIMSTLKIFQFISRYFATQYMYEVIPL